MNIVMEHTHVPQGEVVDEGGKHQEEVRVQLLVAHQGVIVEVEDVDGLVEDLPQYEGEEVGKPLVVLSSEEAD